MPTNESNIVRPETPTRRKVAICGMHLSICDLIARKLRQVGFLEVVGIYRDTAAVLRDARHTHPGIVILDTELHGKNLAYTLNSFRQMLPDSKIVLFTAAVLKPELLASFPAGTVYVSNKHDHASQLLDVIRKASNVAGEPELPWRNHTEEPLPDDYDDKKNVKIKGTLSDNEIRILTLITLSNTTKQIANLLGISAHTVWNYRARIMYKISAKDQAGMVRYALAHGIIDPHL
jgi:DNA-binding NarL/FixJ family response regulator